MYPGLLGVILEARGDVGPGPYNRKFVQVVEEASHGALMRATRNLLWTPLPATGQRPDVELIADGGAFGKYFSRGGDDFLNVGAIVPWPVWPYRLPVPLGWICTAGSGSADAEREQLRGAVAAAGLGRLEDFVSGFVGTACGDQAMATGGQGWARCN